MKSEKSPSDQLDLEESIPFTEEDREALWQARIESQEMSTEEYLRFLKRFPGTEPDRTIRGIPGDELEL